MMRLLLIFGLISNAQCTEGVWLVIMPFAQKFKKSMLIKIADLLVFLENVHENVCEYFCCSVWLVQ